MLSNNTTLMAELNRCVRETVHLSRVAALLDKAGYSYSTLSAHKTEMGDEFVQVVSRNRLLVIVGSTSEGREWLHNIKFRSESVINKRGTSARIHRNFLSAAKQILNHPEFIRKRNTEVIGTSRGAIITAIMCFIEPQFRGRGTASPRGFKYWINLPNYTNMVNTVDLIGKVVPGWSHVGVQDTYKFWKRPHTGWVEHLRKVNK